MQTPFQYAKQAYAEGRFPSILIAAGEVGTFWLEDANYRTLKGACYTSRDAAEKARSKVLDKVRKLCPVG